MEGRGTLGTVAASRSRAPAAGGARSQAVSSKAGERLRWGVGGGLCVPES